MSGSSASVTVKMQQVQIQIQAIIVAVTVEPPTETEHQRVETGILRRILERQQENSLPGHFSERVDHFTGNALAGI